MERGGRGLREHGPPLAGRPKQKETQQTQPRRVQGWAMQGNKLAARRGGHFGSSFLKDERTGHGRLALRKWAWMLTYGRLISLLMRTSAIR